MGDEKNSPCSDRLPIGWVISGSLPPSVNSTSSCFKCVVEDSSLTEQIKSWYELEFYGAFKQVDVHHQKNQLKCYLIAEKVKKIKMLSTGET